MCQSTQSLTNITINLRGQQIRSVHITNTAWWKEHYTLKQYSTTAMYCITMNVSIEQPLNVDTKTKATLIVYQVCLILVYGTLRETSTYSCTLYDSFESFCLWSDLSNIFLHIVWQFLLCWTVWPRWFQFWLLFSTWYPFVSSLLCIVL